MRWMRVAQAGKKVSRKGRKPGRVVSGGQMFGWEESVGLPDSKDSL